MRKIRPDHRRIPPAGFPEQCFSNRPEPVSPPQLQWPSGSGNIPGKKQDAPESDEKALWFHVRIGNKWLKFQRVQEARSVQKENFAA